MPVTRAGMASGTADLQRDLGGAIMQSILGALLTAGYAAAAGAAIASSPNGSKVSENVEGELTKSFSSAADTASQYPHYSSQIIAAAKTSFLQGDQWAYTAGIVAILASAPPSSSSSSPSGMRSVACSSSTTPKTPRPKRRRPQADKRRSAPDRIRTCDLRFRRLAFCSVANGIRTPFKARP